MNIGLPNLAQLRQARNLTQAQLAAELGFHARSVIRWENGQSDPLLGDVRKIAAHFGVTVGQLIGEYEIPNLTQNVARARFLS